MALSAKSPERIALVVGAKTGNELSAGNRDVTHIYYLLTAPEFGGCSKNSPKPILECHDRGEFDKILTTTLEDWRGVDQLVFYFTGHGKIVSSTYCLQLGLTKNDLFPFNNLITELRIRGVKRSVIILDTCYSGAAAGVKSLDNLPSLDDYDIPKGIALIASSRATESSLELPDGSESVFTHILCSGIEKGLDGRQTSDGYITIEDIVNYVNAKLKSEEKFANFLQRPAYRVDDADRSIWISKNISGPYTQNEDVDAIKSITSYDELRLAYEITHPDKHPCPDVEDHDLKWDLVNDIFSKIFPKSSNLSNKEKLLTRLKLYSPISYKGKASIHKSAVLCFAHRPDLFYEQAKSLFVVGNPKDDNFVREDITGPLSNQAIALIERVKNNLSNVSYIAEDGRRREKLEIDLEVVRELISNAITHRDYSINASVTVTLTNDALEIRSPGWFPNGTSWNDFLSSEKPVSCPVNIAISHYLSNLLVFEGIGRGFDVFRQYIKLKSNDCISCTELPGPTTLIRVLRRKPNKYDIHTEDDTPLVKKYYQLVQPKEVDDLTLERAKERLSKLPLQFVPETAALPMGSRVPFSSNPLFIGRKQDFRSLARMLKGGHINSVVQIVAITGLGGIGKTQFASEFVHRYGQFFSGGVFWINFSEPQVVPTEIAACSSLGENVVEIETNIKSVLSSWQSALPRLVVFDNCEDEELLNHWLPRGGGCRVLLTSRRQTWNAALGVKILKMSVLKRAESVSLMQTCSPGVNDDEAFAIAAELGDHPLALHLAGSFLSRYDSVISPPLYLEQLKDDAMLKHESLTGRGASFSPTRHDLHIARTFALSYDKLDNSNTTDRTSIALLCRATAFAHGIPIAKSLLFKTLSEQYNEIDQLQKEDSLERLKGLGLIQADTKATVVLHPLLARYMIAMSVEDDSQNDVEKVLLAEARKINQTGNPAILKKWHPHLKAVTDKALIREDAMSADLCNELGYHMQAIGDYEGSRYYYDKALLIRKKLFGEEHCQTAESLNNIGSLLQANGDYQNARSYLENALEIYIEVFGDEHHKTATNLNNIGSLLQAMGDYESAIPYCEKALMIRKKEFGEEHPDTSTSLNNLGMLLHETGDYEGARSYYEKSLEINRKTLGDEHPSTATSLNNLGALLQAMGDYEGARPYYERALKVRKNVLGEDHPNTATSLNNLGSILKSMNDYEGARSYYEKSLEINRKTLGDEHPSTATSLNNLGALLQAMGDYEGARPYYENGLKIYKKVFGEEHPKTASSLNNIGLLFQTMEKYEGARTYFEKAYSIVKKLLGENHPNAITVKKNIDSLIFKGDSR